MNYQRIKVLGVPVDSVNMQQAVQIVDDFVCTANKAETVIAVNPEKVIKAQQDTYLADRLDSASLLIPDGIGIVFAARILGLARMKRVAGAELMPKICELACEKGYKVFLFGAEPEVNQKACDHLRKVFPGIQIAGNQHGYVMQDEMSMLVQKINQSGAQILFIALGSPRQELWMEEYLPHLKVKVCQGVGGTFDVLSGKVQRAPKLFRLVHLEWFYRLASQPRRIIRQTALPKFVYLVFRCRLFGI